MPSASLDEYKSTNPWNNFKEIVALPAQDAYRPFIEDGKVWKFGILNCGNPMKVVDYYYFDGDTIIDGRTCKQMMCQRYVSPDYQHVELPSLSKVGAWYEENQKVSNLRSQFSEMLKKHKQYYLIPVCSLLFRLPENCYLLSVTLT